MKYIVRFQLQPECKARAVELFESQGPNRNPGVSFLQAWIGLHSDVAFVLVESSDEALLSKAAQTWSQFGEYEVHPVTDIEQF